MALKLTSLTDLAALGFDDIIDVRSPSEFAEDHVPGAINLPVLSDAERAEVGTVYVQEDRFKARKIGAAYVARNAARYLETRLSDRPGGWRPLVYCWRGGQRSGSFASILSQIGWRVELLDGGYKSYRALVVAMLYDGALRAPVVLLDGHTGTAKTELLGRLAQRGHQVIDLEGLANHRGSLFGYQGAQPSQKAFESRLAMALAGMDPVRPILLEAESNKVGDLLIPPALWKAMQAAPRLRITAPVSQRAAYLARSYADIAADGPLLQATLDALVPYHGRDVVAGWQALAASGQIKALAQSLMETHYDPRYAKSAERWATQRVEIAATSLSDGGLEALAQDVEQALDRVITKGQTIRTS